MSILQSVCLQRPASFGLWIPAYHELLVCHGLLACRRLLACSGLLVCHGALAPVSLLGTCLELQLALPSDEPLS